MKKDFNIKYEKCIINIKIISKLCPYDRLIFNHDYFSIRQYSYLIGIIRYFSNESRKDIILGLNELYLDIESINDEYKSDTLLGDKFKTLSKEIEHLHCLDNKGLNALLVTYSNDRSIMSKIEFLIDKFKLISQILIKQ